MIKFPMKGKILFIILSLMILGLTSCQAKPHSENSTEIMRIQKAVDAYYSERGFYDSSEERIERYYHYYDEEYKNIGVLVQVDWTPSDDGTFLLFRREKNFVFERKLTGVEEAKKLMTRNWEVYLRDYIVKKQSDRMTKGWGKDVTIATTLATHDHGGLNNGCLISLEDGGKPAGYIMVRIQDLDLSIKSSRFEGVYPTFEGLTAKASEVIEAATQPGLAIEPLGLEYQSYDQSYLIKLSKEGYAIGYAPVVKDVNEPPVPWVDERIADIHTDQIIHVTPELREVMTVYENRAHETSINNLKHVVVE